jgi:hypothetical protein
MLNEPLKIEHITVHLRDLDRDLIGTRIVQFSDLHDDGVRLDNALFEQCIRECNKIEPDLILLTGDYITHELDPLDGLLEKLGRLNSRVGTFAILGNHDSYKASLRHKITQAMTSINIEVLWNSYATPLGPNLLIVGLADLYSGEFQPEKVFSQLDESIPRIVLSHNPDTAELLQKYRVDLQLSGHTHGGQVVLPWIGPVPRIFGLAYQLFKKRQKDRYFLAIKHWEWSQGLHHIGDNLLYVNRGLGSYFPGRLFCPPEMTVIKLEKL